MTSLGLDYAAFDAVFDDFANSPTSTAVFRWEGLQHYDVDYDEPSWRAFREGTARPDRSIRTDPWLARIARTTLGGKRWERIRYVVEPLTEYTRWELLAYGESAPAGEQIGIVTHLPEPVALLPDFWVFDGTEPSDQRAVVMHYSYSGEPVEFELREDPVELGALYTAADVLRGTAEPLNAYLARRRAEVPGVA